MLMLTFCYRGWQVKCWSNSSGGLLSPIYTLETICLFHRLPTHDVVRQPPLLKQVFFLPKFRKTFPVQGKWNHLLTINQERDLV